MASQFPSADTSYEIRTQGRDAAAVQSEPTTVSKACIQTTR